MEEMPDAVAISPSLENLRVCLVDKGQPIGKRTHAAFFLRTLGTPAAVSAVGEGVWSVVDVDSDSTFAG